MKSYLGLPELAQLAGTSERAVEKAAARSVGSINYHWRGARLSVRTVRGRGGRSGLRYEVLVSSLPLDLQWRLKASEAVDTGALEFAPDGASEREWWHHILSPVLDHEKGSKARGQAIRDILSRPLTDWTGKPFSPSQRTIERQVKALEELGLAGLMPRRRADKGTSKVIVSQVWDKAAPFDDDMKKEVASRLRAYIRGLYKDGAKLGIISRLSGEKLRSLSGVYLRRSHGIDCVPDQFFPEEVCKVPRAFIEAESSLRAVATYNRDRKAYEDKERPRIQRTSAGMLPMDLVVGDVHHLDIVMCREDGSEAWPKLIAWCDQATRRVRVDVVLLEKGKGIRNADVIKSFIAMTQDETWGMPHMLYLDNGSEYRWPEFVDDALKLVRAHTPGFISSIEYFDRAEKSATVRAKPYNAAAKVIEGIFGHLEQNIFNTIPGWVGGDRMNKKTAKVGRPTQPFSGGIDELRHVISAHLTIYNSTAQKGDLRGRSPADVYRTALEGGWQRITIDPNELRSVFATEKPVKLLKGSFTYGNRLWTCDALTSHIGKTVLLRIPKFEEPCVVPVMDEAGDLIGFAAPAEVYGVLDPRGAVEANRRARLKQEAVRQLARTAPDVSTTEEIMKSAARVPALPAAPVAGRISVNSEVVQGLGEEPEEREERLHRELQRNERERVEALERNFKRISGGRA